LEKTYFSIERRRAVCGDQEVFRKYNEFLKDLGKALIYSGVDCNDHKMKLAINLFMGLTAETFSEVLAFSLYNLFKDLGLIIAHEVQRKNGLAKIMKSRPNSAIENQKLNNVVHR
jgi:hypothetical protein